MIFKLHVNEDVTHPHFKIIYHYIVKPKKPKKPKLVKGYKHTAEGYVEFIDQNPSQVFRKPSNKYRGYYDLMKDDLRNQNPKSGNYEVEEDISDDVTTETSMSAYFNEMMDNEKEEDNDYDSNFPSEDEGEEDEYNDYDERANSIASFRYKPYYKNNLAGY